MSEPSYPRSSARTRRFTLGRPRGFSIAGGRVFFLRTASGTDPAAALWTLEPDGTERLIAEPTVLLGQGEETLTDEERARRERSRETGAGIVSYAIDTGGETIAFALSSSLYVVTAPNRGATITQLATAGPVIDPRPDPTGARVAYVTGGTLHVIEIATGADQVIAAEPEVTWGLAEFVASEEMGRDRGYWWAPDGRRLLAARVDERPVQKWWIADPANPGRRPRAVAYPAAGTPNADVALGIVDLEGSTVRVDWDRAALPYLITAGWTADGPWSVVMARDQRRSELHRIDPETGTTTLEHADEDPHWVDVVPGVPSWTDGGRLVLTADDSDTRRLVIGGQPVTPPGLQVVRVEHAGATVVFIASDEPTERHVYRVDPGSGQLDRLTPPGGVYDAAADDELAVITALRLDSDEVTTTVHRPGSQARAGITIRSVATPLPFQPRVSLLRCGSNELRTAVVFPQEPNRPTGALPVLVDPYGGPHAQRVVAIRGAYLEPQWYADQGYAVVVCDGRGTPMRGPAWERAVHHDLAGPVLDDQVDALQAVAAEHPGELDLGRVAIRGWSFGGFLAALAVLRRPDVFHAAIAGAPVTDWRLYDTFYTERYLGLPQGSAGDPYERCSLIPLAEQLKRPLMLIHGLADDNVVVAHTLALSSALLAAGRPHTLLPLSGVTHLTPQEVVAENLLFLQVQFLAQALGSAQR